MASPVFSPIAHAQSYNPGVIAGQYVTFGQVSVTLTGPGPAPSFITQLNNTQSITVQVNSVNMAAKNVTATQTYNYKNGTTQSKILTGNVATGAGNLSIWIIAGGLSAGDQLTQGGYSFLGGLTETVARPYVGAVRPVNVLVANNPIYNITAVWDQSTGFLIELSEAVNTFYPSQTFTIHAKVTATNAWTASSLPDFSLDATPQTSSIIHLGQSATFNLNLTSLNAYYGSVSLTSQLLNSSLANPPTLSLTQNSVQVPAGGSVQDSVTFSTSASTVLGLYLFKITANSPGLSHIATIAVYVIPPDYQIFATPTNLTATVGSTKTTTIIVKAQGLFSGTVQLISSASTSLIQTSLDHSSVTLSPTVPNANSTLTVNATSFLLPGDYSASVSGTSGNLQHSLTVPITVTGPDFLIYTNTTTISLVPSTSATATIGLKSLGGFTGTVALSASVYGGFAADLNPSTVTLSGASGQTTLTISAPKNAIPGNYYITITGVSGILTHQTSISVTVSQPGFSASPNPYQLTISPGNTATSTITLTSLNGFQGKVALAASIDSFYPQLGFALNPTNVTLTPGGTATSTITLSAPTAISGYFPSGFVNIYAVSGNVSSQSSIYYQISSQSPPIVGGGSPGYSIYSNPFFLNIPRGGNGNSTINLYSYNNFVGELSLNTTVQGGPIGTCPGPNCPTASINPIGVYLSANNAASSTLRISVSASAPAASYYVTISSSNGTDIQTTTVWVQVTVPDFSINFNVYSLSLPSGEASATPSVVLSSIQGFTGTITLTRAIQGPVGVCPGPNCLTATLGSTSLTLPVNRITGTSLTITTTASTLPGQYSIVVNATTAGGLHHSATISITVGFKDFGISATPDTVILAPGGSRKVAVSLGSLNGFNGNVTVTVGNLTPLTITPSAKNVTLASGGWTTMLLTVSASTPVSPGNYYAYVTAANGTTTHYTSLTIIVASPDFEIYSNPNQISMSPGTIARSTIILLSLDGLHGTVTLGSPVVSGPGCPGAACPTASLTRSNVPLTPGGWGYSNLTITAPSSAVLGYYSVMLTATNATLTHTINISVDVTSQTSTSIACSTPVLAGTTTSCTVTVNNAATNPAAPSGAVTLTTNSKGTLTYYCSLTTATATSATCTINYTPRIAGSHTITANYAGDGTHSVSSGSTTLAASSRGSSATISCTGAVLAGQASTCTATVTDTSGSGTITPYGTIAFTNTGLPGYFTPASCYLVGTTASASCSVSFTPTASGTANINAVFAGDQAHSGSSTSSPATINASKRTSALSISCMTPVTTNQPSTCTASVTDMSSVGSPITPSGTLTFSSTGTGSLSATSCTLSSGSCSISFTGTAVETATVNGTYAGDTAHTGSSSPVSTITITAPPPDFSLNTSPSSLTITQGSSTTTTITVTATGGFSGTVSLSATAPSGITVTFNPSGIGPGQNSVMTVTVSSTLAAGSYSVTVTGISGSITHQKTESITVSSQTQQTQPFFGLPTYFYALLAAPVAAAGLGAFVVLRRKKSKVYHRTASEDSIVERG